MSVVFTNPDRLEEGEHGPWLNILNGESHHTKHGIFVVRNPGPLSENTFDEDREIERRLLMNRPWCQVKMKQQLGVPALSKKISEILNKIIDAR